MSVSQSYLDYVVERLSVVGPVTVRRMFGGAGLYHRGFFFALVDDDVLYFKADDTNRTDYEEAGMSPFRPFADKPDYVMAYYELPGDVLEDDASLKAWAMKAVAVAAAKSKSKAVPRKSNVKRSRRT